MLVGCVLIAFSVVLSKLIDTAGYTYEYIGSEDLQLPLATVRGNILAADGPAYKALVFENQTVISVAGAKSVLGLVNAGLPVFFVGNPPNQSDSAAPGAQEEVYSLMQDILASENSHRVSDIADLPAALSGLSITPRVTINCGDNQIYSVWRNDPSVQMDYVYLFNQGHALKSCPLTFSVSNNSVPFVYDAWTGTQSPLFSYERSQAGISAEVSLTMNQTLILAFKSGENYQGWGCPLKVVNGSKPIFKENSSGNATIDLRGPCTIESGSGRSWSFAATPPGPTNLSNWNITIEDWHSSPNRSAVQNVITTTQFTNHSLVPWRLLGPGYEAVSGIGIYTTSFIVPQGDLVAGKLGALLNLGPVDNTIRAYVDGKAMAPIDITNGVVDLGDALGDSAVPGSTHTLKVEVSSTLFNRVKADLDSVMVFGTRASQEQPEYANSTAKDYGLVGPVVLQWYIEQELQDEDSC